jgi:type VI secretion system protein ImpA
MSPSPVPPLDVEAIVAPIRGPFPAGVDIRYDTKLGTYDKIKAARREATDKQQGNAGLEDVDDGLSPEERAASAGRNWIEVRTLVVEALTTQSKDLQMAIWLLEAETYISGFAGAASSFDIIRRLIENYWDTLFPPIDPEDEEPLALRVGALDWVNERMPQILSGIPLSGGTRRYSLALLQLAQRATDDKQKAELAAAGRPSTEQFAQAMAGSSLQHLEALEQEVQGCLTQLKQLDQVCDTRFLAPAAGGGAGEPLISFTAVRKVLEDCEFQVQRALRAKGAKDPKAQAVTGGVAPAPGAEGGASAPVTGDSIWDRALQLVLQGQLEGLRVAQEHIEAAVSGRERFLRQLQLSELCVQVGMHAFAYPILDELGKLIVERNLATWEDPDVIRRTWSSLANACRPLARIRPESVARQAEAQQQLESLVGTAETTEPATT